jgi:hypothetical protein
VVAEVDMDCDQLLRTRDIADGLNRADPDIDLA